MRDLALRRLQLIPIPRGKGVAVKKKTVMLTELAQMGYRVVNHGLLDQASGIFLQSHQEVMTELARLRGGNVTYVPLFDGFPNRVPKLNTHFIRRVLGYVLNWKGYNKGTTLEDGTVVPEWLFDLDAFGANPITEMQSAKLLKKGADRQAKREGDTEVAWIDLELIFEDELPDRLLTWLHGNLYSKAPIKEAYHEDIKTLLAFFETERVTFSQITQKENRALVLRLLWQEGLLERVAQGAQTPTDLLRLFAALTDSNIALYGGVRFPKFTRAQRRTVMSVLERSPALAEDLNRYKGLWLAVAKALHSGEYAKTHPKAHGALQTLREGKIQTYNAKTEALIRSEEVASLLEHLRQRPGILARKIHELLRRFGDQTQAILAVFAEASPKMTVKNLLVLHAYFQVINQRNNRAVVNRIGKLSVVPNTSKGSLSANQIRQITELVEAELLARFGQEASWYGKKVYVEPDLANFTVPLQQRKGSDGLINLDRGARVPLEMETVLRLFVYWKQKTQRTDLDLSAIMFDANFEYLDHVSYTNLAALGAVHSGDIQSAPKGAAEFIDLPLKRIPANVRYVASSVYRYCGERFDKLTAHAGWMMRRKPDARQATFDIKTVVNKFDLNGKGGYCIPLVVDLHRHEAIWTDLYYHGRPSRNRVENSFDDIREAAKEIADFTMTRPDMKTLADLHLKARGGEPVDVPGEADIRFARADADYTPFDIEKILSELL